MLQFTPWDATLSAVSIHYRFGGSLAELAWPTQVQIDQGFLESTVPALNEIVRTNALLAFTYFFAMGWMATLPAQSFTDVTATSGLNFSHFGGGSGQNLIIESSAGGIVTFDYDLDGRTDVYITNGTRLFSEAIQQEPRRNRLFRNVSTPGDLKFEDVTLQAGVGDVSFSLGATAGDIDNDGDQDLFVTNYGNNQLYENLGDGTFVARPHHELLDVPRMGAGVAMADIDLDGDADILIANYVLFDKSINITRQILGVEVGPGPQDYQADSDTLLLNDGQGGFVDVSQEYGLSEHAGRGMGIVAIDYDQDGDPDFFVCNDTDPNFLYENDGTGRFTEVGALAGVAYDAEGSEQGSMGVDCADYNNDGIFDLVTTVFEGETPTLYENSGQLFFDDQGAAAGLAHVSQSVSWGVGFADFNNDMHQDLFIASGHVFQDESVRDSGSAFPNSVLRSVEGKRFVPDWGVQPVDRSAETPAAVSRGVALEDFDRDGDIDAVVVNLNESAQLLENTLESKSKSLQIELVGTSSNRDAIGAQIQLVTTQGNQWRCVQSGRGYQSHFGSRLHFGIDESSVSNIEVVWPSGEIQRWTDLPPDAKLLLLVENVKHAAILDETP